MSTSVYDRRAGTVWKVTAFKASCPACGEVLRDVFADMNAAVRALELHAKNVHEGPPPPRFSR